MVYNEENPSTGSDVFSDRVDRGSSSLSTRVKRGGLGRFLTLKTTTQPLEFWQEVWDEPFWPGYSVETAIGIKAQTEEIAARDPTKWRRLVDALYNGVYSGLIPGRETLRWLQEVVNTENITPYTLKQMVVYEVLKGLSSSEVVSGFDNLISEWMIRIRLNGGISSLLEVFDQAYRVRMGKTKDLLIKMVRDPEIYSIEDSLLVPRNASAIGVRRSGWTDGVVYEWGVRYDYRDCREALLACPPRVKLSLSGIDASGKSVVAEAFRSLIESGTIHDLCQIIDVGHPYKGNVGYFQELTDLLRDHEMRRIELDNLCLQLQQVAKKIEHIKSAEFDDEVNCDLQDLYFRSRKLLFKILSMDPRGELRYFLIRSGFDGAAYFGEDVQGFLSSIKREVEARHFADLSVILVPPYESVQDWSARREHRDSIDSAPVRFHLSVLLNFAVLSELFGSRVWYMKPEKGRFGLHVGTPEVIARTIAARAGLMPSN